MTKQILCEKCSSVFDPLMDLNGNVFCPNCEKIEILSLSEVKKSDLFIKYNKILQKFDTILKKIKYPGELFLASLTEHTENIRINMTDGVYPINFLEYWTSHQFLLERIVLIKLDISKMHPTPPDQRNPIDFGYLRPDLEQSIRAKRSIKDLTTGEIVFARKKASTDNFSLHLTSKKILIGTPKELSKIIFRRNPFQ